MRYWISGPRLFGGLIRPGISWSPRDFDRIRRPAAAPKQGAYVYVIEGAHGRQKIGHSDDPDRRRDQLQTGSPVPLVIKHSVFAGANAPLVEGEAQSILFTKQVVGEWFEVTPEAAIAAVYGAAAKLGVALGEPGSDDEDEFDRYMKRRIIRQWIWFGVGIVIFNVTLHWLIQPR